MKGILIKYLTQKNRNIISIFIIILGVLFMYNYMFNSPTYINKYIATKIYKEPANSTFTDQNFYNCVINAYNRTNNANRDYTDSLSDEELTTITSLQCNGYNKSDEEKIISTSGLEKLTDLTLLYLNYNKISTIDISHNSKLKYFEIEYNQLTDLDVSNNTDISWLIATKNQLTELDTSNNINLGRLEIDYNQLTEIDVSNNSMLDKLNISDNQINELDIRNNINLTRLDVSSNQLTELDISNNHSLNFLSANNNQLISLDASNNPEITQLWASNNQLELLNISNCLNLIELLVYNNQLTEINIANNKALKKIYFDNNQLTSLDVSNFSNLIDFRVENNQLTSLIISNTPTLTYLYIGTNKLTELDVSTSPQLLYIYAWDNKFTSFDVSKNLQLATLNLYNNELTEIDLSKNLELRGLDLMGNKIAKLDLTNNTKLTSLSLLSNIFSENIVIYKNDNANILDYANNNLKLPQGESTLVTSYTEYIKNDGTIKSTNGGKFSDNLLQLKFNFPKEQDFYQRYDFKFDLYVLEATSDKYIIDEENNSIYIGIDNNNTSIINNINLNYGIGSIENNKYIIKYNDKIIKEFNLVNLVSNKYDLSKDYIYVGFNDVSNLTNDISCANCEVSTSNNMLEVRYNNIKADEYPIVRLNTEYERRKNIIFVLDDYGNNETILNKITCTNGNLSIEDNKLIVKNNDEVIDEYKLYSENKYIDSDEYSFDKEKMTAYNLNNGLLISELISNTESSGVLQVLDKNGSLIDDTDKVKTGYILRATFNQDPTNKLDYRLSVRGDVLGEGKISIEGTKKVMRHIIDGNVITGDEYLYAADYDSNGLIKMNDVTRMLIEKNQ